MNVLTYFEENDVAFLRTPKFLRRITSPHAAELYALLRERRRWLVDKKQIRNHDSWFFYPTKELQDDLQAPNSLNHLKALLKDLTKLHLVEIKIDERPPYTKYYKLNDEVYFKLAQRDAISLTKKNEKSFDELQNEVN